MEKSNKAPVLFIICVFVILSICGLVGIILMMNKLANTNTNSGTQNTTTTAITTTTTNPKSDQLINDFTYQPTLQKSPEKINYNFSLQLASTGLQENWIPIQLIEASSIVPAAAQSDTVNKIQIPALGVNAPIIHDIDGKKAIDQGWWMYPASKPQGEKIILAHRRYWPPGNPYSAWNIDTLPIGAEIKVYDQNGQVYNYQVAAQSINEGSDLSIFVPANDDILKIITCSTFSGAAGSASHRFVTIARRVV
ncbi:MAG: sortase [bacterium]